MIDTSRVRTWQASAVTFTPSSIVVLVPERTTKVYVPARSATPECQQVPRSGKFDNGAENDPSVAVTDASHTCFPVELRTITHRENRASAVQLVLEQSDRLAPLTVASTSTASPDRPTADRLLTRTDWPIGMRPARKSSLPVRSLISGPAKIDHMRLQVLPRKPARAQLPTLAVNPAFTARLEGGRAPTFADTTVPTATGRDVTADLHRPADTDKDAGS